MKPITNIVTQACTRMSTSFNTYPRANVITFVGFEITTLSVAHAIIMASGVHVPSQLAVAFALSRPFRRVRLPLELAGAASLVKVFPALSTVKPSSLLPDITTTFPFLSRTRNNRVSEMASKIGNAIDNYGLAYFISARWTGVLMVSGIYTALQTKLVDVDKILQWAGVSMQFDTFMEMSGAGHVGSLFAPWAAAVVLNSATYPFSIYIGSTIVAPFLARHVPILDKKKDVVKIK